MPTRSLLRAGLLVALALLPPTAGCGKKGPPLAPIIPVPAAVSRLDARRVGSDVFITLTVPSQNIDMSTPANVGRVDVYGYTGRVAPPRTRWVEFGTLVTSVPVMPLPVEPTTSSSPDGEAESSVPGANVTIRDMLTVEDLVQGPVPPVEKSRPTVPAVSSTDTRELPLRRFYLAIPFSSRGRPGPPGTVAEFALEVMPDVPQDLQSTMTETSVSLTWEPSGGLVGYLFETPLTPEPSPTEDFDAVRPPSTEKRDAAQAGPTRYNVYREPPLITAPLVQPAKQPWVAVPDVPMNAQPLAETQFADAAEFGRQRCYTVRAVRGTPPQTVESESSIPVCLTPVDVFPPAAPTALAAVAAEGAISLIWEPNTEPDLGGYLVLRGKAGDATLQPVTEMPVMEARYRDTAAMPGVRYAYAVVAVDTATPKANVSLESNRVEETAR
jgi:predicted small lipoprotein YifL